VATKKNAHTASEQQPSALGKRVFLAATRETTAAQLPGKPKRDAVAIHRGLKHVRSLLDVHLSNGEAGELSHLSEEEIADVQALIGWIDVLPDLRVKKADAKGGAL
jgi:hypothetical protein